MGKAMACPFCGQPGARSNELSKEMFASCDNPKCVAFGWGMPEKLWQIRPIEDALRGELERVRGNVATEIPETDGLINYHGRAYIGYAEHQRLSDIGLAELYAARKRVTLLEQAIDKIIDLAGDWEDNGTIIIEDVMDIARSALPQPPGLQEEEE